jgi:phage tail-like protein
MSTSDPKTERRSSYLEYLPAIYRDDPLIGQFLLIFESILSPIEHSIDNVASYFDPSMTPEHFLPWLASWLDLSLDPTWPEDKRRELVKSAVELYRWRGTRWGLTEYIRIYTGVEPEIYEYVPGMTLDHDTKMGSDAQLGSGVDWYHFTVVLPVDKTHGIEDSKIRAIIEVQKPAHSTYSLRFVPINRD